MNLSKLCLSIQVTDKLNIGNHYICSENSDNLNSFSQGSERDGPSQNSISPSQNLVISETSLSLVGWSDTRPFRK